MDLDADPVAQATAPFLSTALAETGDAATPGLVPLVYVRGTPGEILDLAENEDVIAVYAAGQLEAGTEANAAGASLYLPEVTPTTVDGTGVRVGIVEYALVDGGPIDHRAPFIFVKAIDGGRDAVCDVDGPRPDELGRGEQIDHAYQVATLAVGHDTTGWDGPDAAPDATLLEVSANLDDALDNADRLGNDADYRAAVALTCGVRRGLANVLNLSYIQNRPGYTGLTYTIDYLTSAYGVTIVNIAGNRLSGHCRDGFGLLAPATSWNAITVGGIDDRGDTNPGNDTLWVDGAGLERYCWRDGGGPFGARTDHIKPEVLAPAQDLDFPRSFPDSADDGTSLAAPLITGIVARMMERSPSLRTYSEAVRAILFASAAGRTKFAVRSDRYGLGVPRADWAVDIAHGADASVFKAGKAPPKDWLDGCGPRNITMPDIPANWRVRFVVTWNAHPPRRDVPAKVTRRFPIETNLDLRIKKDGAVIKGGKSMHLNSNVEWVDFTTSGGTNDYVARIEITEPDGSDCDDIKETIGWAWVAVPR
jgi:hypothetical protein